MSVMPGALIIESMAQSAGTLVMYSLKKIKKIFQYTYLLLIKLNLESQSVLRYSISQSGKKQNVKNIWKFKCTSFVDDKLVATEVSAIINSAI